MIQACLIEVIGSLRIHIMEQLCLRFSFSMYMLKVKIKFNLVWFSIFFVFQP